MSKTFTNKEVFGVNEERKKHGVDTFKAYRTTSKSKIPVFKRGRIPTGNVHVSTSDYEFAHGKKPSGTGSWAFRLGTKNNIRFVKGSKTYAEAKRQAKKLAARAGIGWIQTGS